MALYGDLTYDSRVRREAAALAHAGHDVVLACLASNGPRDDLPDAVRVEVVVPTATSILPGVPGPRPRSGRLGAVVGRARWLVGYGANLRAWGRLVVDRLPSVDAWHLHDLPALVAVAPRVPPAVPIVYDAHELFLDAGTGLRLPGLFRTLLRRYERRLIRRASAVVTVNRALAAVIARRYRPTRIEVVHNCPDRWDPPPQPRERIREAAGIATDARIVLYHGGLGPHRGIEPLMDAMLRPELEDVHLVLLGFGETRDAYLHAAASARWSGRLHVLEAVPPSELLSWVASADVGAVVIEASTLNHYLSTPNKLFECLAAGVPVVASDFPAMRPIVAEAPGGPLGELADPGDVRGVVAAIRSILDLDPSTRAELRRRCLAAAHDRWNWQAESSRLTALYEALLTGPAAEAEAQLESGAVEVDGPAATD
jgi:glycosyltransferase involved in cell wall biosynthesis